MIPIFRGADAIRRLAVILARDHSASAEVQSVVASIIADVRLRGDAAVRVLAARFGDAVPKDLRLPTGEIGAAVEGVHAETQGVLERSAASIRKFAEGVMAGIRPVRIDYDAHGCGLEYKPVASAGCYVPGGRYPLPSTALMTAMTARVAGVERICIVSPRLTPEILFAGRLACVEEFYRVGGAQAVAALAFGTESIPAVDMIAGPGNAYVTEAKRQLFGVVGLDMLAGPSEVCIIADETADPALIAFDLLSQLEHDPGARGWLLTTDGALAAKVANEVAVRFVELQLDPFVKVAAAASAVLVFTTIVECVEASNRIAPEHLQLHVADPWSVKSQVVNYGALFLGAESTVAFGDYMAGPNHTLPTGRSARFSGALTPLTFLRAQSWMEVRSPDSRQLASDTAAFAGLEGLKAHAAAARARSGRQMTNAR